MCGGSHVASLGSSSKQRLTPDLTHHQTPKVGLGEFFGFCFVLWGLVLCWEVLWFWNSIWNFGVGFGRCFVFFLDRVMEHGVSLSGVLCALWVWKG